uniref:Uncharacterized protein n=1 Tax=viral metagenome TaxID=1070528 RepID=A0A2V0RAL7_9ZZZZ
MCRQVSASLFPSLNSSTVATVATLYGHSNVTPFSGSAIEAASPAPDGHWGQLAQGNLILSHSAKLMLEKARLYLSTMSSSSVDDKHSLCDTQLSRGYVTPQTIDDSFIDLDQVVVDEDYEASIGSGKYLPGQIPTIHTQRRDLCRVLGFYDVSVLVTANADLLSAPKHSHRDVVDGDSWSMSWHASTIATTEMAIKVMSIYGGVAIRRKTYGAATLALMQGASPSRVPLLDSEGNVCVRRSGIGLEGLKTVASTLSL